MFFHSTVVSSLTYGCVCWGGKLSKQDKSRLEKIKKGGGILGRKQDSFDTLYKKQIAKKLNHILCDDTNPLKADFNSDSISTAAVIGHQKPIQAGITILLCQLLSV